jgi:hypothetical protein
MKVIQSIKTWATIWVWKHTPNCAEMSRLASQSWEQPLSFRTRLKMRLHFLICVWCERYSKHLKRLHRAGSHADHHIEKLPGRGLSLEARQRIVQHLKIAQNENL